MLPQAFPSSFLMSIIPLHAPINFAAQELFSVPFPALHGLTLLTSFPELWAHSSFLPGPPGVWAQRAESSLQKLEKGSLWACTLCNPFSLVHLPILPSLHSFIPSVDHTFTVPEIPTMLIVLMIGFQRHRRLLSDHSVWSAPLPERG